ncbi:UDP-N-acetylglucosamine 2-epimerase [Synechococcus sp. WH 8103]|nr:UDP-N-acetylglucosamine 2-epimerase [Synechococcus sp. WH 8103]
MDNLYNPLGSLLFVTGTRADFGKLEPLALAAFNNNFKVSIFVTGMHMFEQYGLTKEEIHRHENFEVTEFVNQREGDPQDIILSKTVLGFSDYVQECKPDLVIVHGDRVEALAAALVCSTNYIRCVHVEGGEVSGTIDELFRHCNTKLAWAHLVSSENAKLRVQRLGESSKSIHVIGSPELDIHCRPTGLTIEDVKSRYDIDFLNYGICIFHPVTSEANDIESQARSLFKFLHESQNSYVVILPNNDPGSEYILKIITRLPRDKFKVLPSMRFLYFSELMRNANAIIGNSSMGVREAPFLGIPSLNVGTRQFNRASSPSILSCSAYDQSSFSLFFKEFWGKRFSIDTTFGLGNAADNFVSLLKQTSFWETPFQKHFSE